MKEDNQMNKKIIGIVIGLLVVVAIIIGLFVLKPWAPSSQDEGNQVDNSELANELDDYIPDMDKEEIEDTLDQEMDDEQQETFDIIIDEHYVPSVDEIDIDEDGTMTYTDKNGNVVVREPNEEIQNMTEEELAAENERIDQSIQDYIGDGSGNPDDPGDEGNAGGNTSSGSNSNTGNNSTVPSEDTPETDSENSHDTAMSEEELGDLIREQMEQNGEIGNDGELTQESKDALAGSITLDQ